MRTRSAMGRKRRDPSRISEKTSEKKARGPTRIGNHILARNNENRKDVEFNANNVLRINIFNVVPQSFSLIQHKYKSLRNKFAKFEILMSQ